MFRKKSLRFMSILTACIMLSSIIASAASAAVATLVSPKSKNLSGRIVEVSVNYDSQSANVKIDTVVLYIDSRMYEKKKLDVPAQKGNISFDWDTKNFARGQHIIEVKLFTNNKVVTSVTGSGIVSDQIFDNNPPVVKFEGIKSGDVVSGKKIINISAKDDSGEPPIVSLLVDNKLKLMQNNAPYNYTLDTTQLEDGEHIVDIYAFDNDGNQSERVSYKLIVNNGSVSVATAPVKAEVKASESKAQSTTVVAGVPSVKKSDTEVNAARAGSEDISVSVESKSSKVTVIAGAEKANGDVFTSKDNGPSISAKLDPAKISEPKNVYEETQEKSKIEKDLLLASAIVNIPEPVNLNVPKPVVIEEAIDIANKGVIGDGVAVTDNKVVVTDKEMSLTFVNGEIAVTDNKVVATGNEITVKPVASLNAPKVSKPNNASVSQSNPVKIAKNVVNGDLALSVPAMDLSVPKAIKAPEASVSAVVSDHSAISAEVTKPVEVEIATSKPVISMEPVKMAKADITSKIPIAGNTGVNLIMPESGKAKIRDIVNKNGGVVLWDGKTKTVTTYINNIKVEMRIGSKTIKVNGQSMVVNVIPRIENGRTVIDVTDLRNAINMAKED